MSSSSSSFTVSSPSLYSARDSFFDLRLFSFLFYFSSYFPYLLFPTPYCLLLLFYPFSSAKKSHNFFSLLFSFLSFHIISLLFHQFSFFSTSLTFLSSYPLPVSSLLPHMFCFASLSLHNFVGALFVPSLFSLILHRRRKERGGRREREKERDGRKERQREKESFSPSSISTKKLEAPSSHSDTLSLSSFHSVFLSSSSSHATRHFQLLPNPTVLTCIHHIHLTQPTVPPPSLNPPMGPLNHAP